MTGRERARLIWHLDQLSSVDGLPDLGVAKPSDGVLQLRVNLEGTVIDWPRIVAKINQPQGQRVDVVLRVPVERCFLVQLEDAPDEVVELDLAHLPAWAVSVGDES